MRAYAAGNDIFMPDELFLDGGLGLTDEGLIVSAHEMGHVWQYQTQGPQYIHAAISGQKSYGNGDVGTGEAYHWLAEADDGVSFDDMGPNSQTKLASFIGQIIHLGPNNLMGIRRTLCFGKFLATTIGCLQKNMGNC